MDVVTSRPRDESAAASTSHRTNRSGRPARNAQLLRLLVVLTLVFAVALLPQPFRAVLATPVSLAAPAALWGRWLYEKSGCDAVQSSGFGLVLALAGWALLQFLLLVAHIDISAVTSSIILFAMCAYPAASVSLPQWRDVNQVRLGSVAVWGIPLVAQGLLLALTMQDARAVGDLPSVFALFWLSMALFFIPIFVLVTRRRARYFWPLVVLAAGTYLPFYLRSPRAPYLGDEIAHWGETVRMLATNALWQPDGYLVVGDKYPGLETLTSGIVRYTDLPVIDAGRFVIFACHVASLLGIFSLARIIGANGRGALIAATVYAISPSFIEIDAMFSYESLAVPFAIWSIVCLLQITRAADRRPWIVASVLVLAALVITHHLTAFAMAAVLLVLAVCAGWRNLRGPDARTLFAGGLGLAAAAIGWAAVTHAPLVTYLGTFVRYGVEGVQNWLGINDATASAGSGGGGSSQQIFSGSVLPGYEHLCAIAAQPILLALFGLALWRNRRSLTRTRVGLAVVGLMYFVSLPLTLIGGASAGAHRSWAITFIGLSVIIGQLFASPASTRAKHRNGTSRTVSVLVVGALAVSLMGSYAAADNAYTRLPGPYMLGTDGRGYTQDMVRSAEWFERTQGPNQPIITNTFSLVVFAAYGAAQSNPYPQWDLFFPRTISDSVKASVLASGNRYVVVDSHLATSPTENSYFAAFEPAPPSVPLPRASLSKFATTPWLHLIHHDGSIKIYKIEN